MLDLQRSNLKWRDLGRNVEILEESSKELAVITHSINSGKQDSESMLYEQKASVANQSVTFVKILPQTNIRIYSYQKYYTNEYIRIFV